jgi:diguanylate cyclase (GGDEF)-like protein
MVVFVTLLARGGEGGYADKVLRLLPGIQARLLLGLGIAVIVPALALPMLGAAHSDAAMQQQNAARLSESAAQVGSTLSHLVNSHVENFGTLVAHINASGTTDARSLQGWLERHHNVNPEILSLLAVDTNGSTLAATAYRKGGAQKYAGPLSPVSDKEFFKQPMESGERYISRLHRGPIPRKAPLLTISEALLDASGEIRGVVRAELNVQALTHQATRGQDVAGTATVIVDRMSRIIHANPSLGMRAFEDLSGHPLTSDLAANPTSIFAFTGNSGNDFLSAGAPMTNGWQVFSLVRRDAMTAAISSTLLTSFVILIFALAAAVVLARALTRGVTSSLQSLESAFGCLDNADGAQVPAPPRDAPSEVAAVFSHFGAAVRRMRESYEAMLNALKEGERLRSELRKMVETRDSQIAEQQQHIETIIGERDKLMRTDDPTGLPNRQSFMDFYEQAWQLAAREQSVLSLVFVQLDQFEDFQGRHGIEAANQALAALGEALTGVSGRPMDMTARFGSDSFACALCDTDLEGALVLAERMRATVQALVIHTPDGEPDVLSASVGVSATRPAGDKEPRKFLKQGGLALAAARKHGRGRVVYIKAGKYRLYDPGARHTRPETQTAERQH